MSATPSSDCRDGKHRACLGDSWDVDADQACACSCSCHTDQATEQDEIPRLIEPSTGEPLTGPTFVVEAFERTLNRELNAAEYAALLAAYADRQTASEGE